MMMAPVPAKTSAKVPRNSASNFGDFARTDSYSFFRIWMATTLLSAAGGAREFGRELLIVGEFPFVLKAGVEGGKELLVNSAARLKERIVSPKALLAHRHEAGPTKMRKMT